MVAEDPEEVRRKAAEGPKLSKADLQRLEKEDGIQQSLDARKATGAINNTIPLPKDAPAEIVFNLKQTGELLQLNEVAEDPEAAKLRAAEGPKVDYKALEKEDDI